MRDVLRFLAAWALVHESADEGWRAAVRRGAELAPTDLEGGPDAFVDGLAALVDAEKERLKRSLAAAEGAGDGAASTGATTGPDGDLAEALGAVRFELAELRGRIETLQASVDALQATRDA